MTFVAEASRGLDEDRTAACLAAWREAGVRFATVAEVVGLMAARGIHHVGIAVTDLDEAIDCYVNLFGATLDHRERVEDQGVEAASLRVGASRVELLAPLGARHAGGTLPREARSRLASRCLCDGRCWERSSSGFGAPAPS